MRYHRNTLLLILFTALAVLGLMLLFNHLRNKTVDVNLSERDAKDALRILIDSAGQNHRVVNESLRGKIVVINVWATWCGPCRQEITELNKLAEKYKGNDKVVFLAVDREDALTEGNAMLKERIAFDYQLLFGEEHLANAILSLKLPSDANAIPMNMVLDPKGHVQIFYVGVQPDKLDQIREYLSHATADVSIHTP